ncbi:MAG: hypothetical protein QOJ82_1033 [Solirubrobacteraceae bacterium]|jgi:glycosyltransferase involved in cell wall biosynthesis|nr:hypothetical protein [Solirubrobacteraceae bacterium]
MTAAAVRVAGRTAIDVVMAIVGLPILLLGLLALLVPGWRNRGGRPRLLWGTTPIKSLSYLAEALRQGGYVSEVAVTHLYPIVKPDDFDHVLCTDPRRNVVVRRIGDTLLAYLFFVRALRRYDVFQYYFDGGVLNRTPLSRLEYPLLRLCGKRLVLLPYGSDTWVLDQVDHLPWRHALMIEYAVALGNNAARIWRRTRRSVRYADVVVGCLWHVVCLPRWDVLPLTCYPIDTDRIQPRPPTTTGTVRIAHASNHRGAKGTEFIIDAVERLRDEGEDVELTLIEGMANDEALSVMAQADIYLDQLVAAYALAALEGMALGKVVISPIEDLPMYDMFRRYSYLAECPIVPATPESVYDVLRNLLQRRDEWPEIGRSTREYCERRHSLAAAREMWEAIYARIWSDEDVDLINFYHPLFERRRREAADRVS